MTEYDNTNRGALFKNEGDRKRENGPDYSGSLNVGGEEFFLDAWIKTSQNGRKFMSMSVKPKAAPKPAPKESKESRRSNMDDMDDIPF